jgi:hypothetical protein
MQDDDQWFFRPIFQRVLVLLVLVSTVAYFALSYGVRNYLSFLGTSLRRVFEVIGIIS